jgi:peptidyl-prolyl cis-trans isomerase SurA
MPYPSYESRRAEPGDPLKKEYQQIRFSEEHRRYIDKLMKEFNYSFHEGTFSSFLGAVDSMSNTGDSAWDARITPEIRVAPLIKIDSVVYSVDTIIAIMAEHPEHQNTILRRREMGEALRRMSEAFLMEAKAAGLEERNAEFAALMKDYTDGIVLYRAEQAEVWDKTSVTDSSLRAYYEAHKADFMFPAKVKIAEMHFASDTTALLVYDSLLNGGDFETLARQHNHDDSLIARGGVRDFQSADENGMTQRAASLKIGEVSEPALWNEEIVIVKLLEMEPPVQKSFDEAGTELANAYQESESKRLEGYWLDRVKEKHPVVQHKEVLKDAFSSPQAKRETP